LSQTATDRNLLLGIRALQMDFISRDALISGMNAWLLEKHRSLDDILEAQGALERTDRALLEPLVRRQIEQHGFTVNNDSQGLDGRSDIYLSNTLTVRATRTAEEPREPQS
jgi:hypothetical protein